MLGAILGQELVFANRAMLDIIATDLVLCILTVEIVEMFVIAKTTPFVTQPTESALVHRDSWAKSRFCILIFVNTMSVSYSGRIVSLHNLLCME